MVRCGVCHRSYPYEDTDLPAWEARLGLRGSLYRPGWTRYVRNEWACSSCVRGGRALRADPSRQTFGGFRGPFFAYWDQARTCGECGGPYVFTAAEQRTWYEERRLLVKVVPVACPPCRRRRAEAGRARRELAQRLASLDPSDAQALAEVAELELRAGSVAKALQYLRRARNRGLPVDARIAELEALPAVERPRPGRFPKAWDPLEQAR